MGGKDTPYDEKRRRSTYRGKKKDPRFLKEGSPGKVAGEGRGPERERGAPGDNNGRLPRQDHVGTGSAYSEQRKK